MKDEADRCLCVCVYARTHTPDMYACVCAHTHNTHTHTHRKNAELEGIAKERRAELAEKQAEEDERLRLEREHTGLVYWGHAYYLIYYWFTADIQSSLPADLPGARCFAHEASSCMRPQAAST